MALATSGIGGEVSWRGRGYWRLWDRGSHFVAGHRVSMLVGLGKGGGHGTIVGDGGSTAAGMVSSSQGCVVSGSFSSRPTSQYQKVDLPN